MSAPAQTLISIPSPLAGLDYEEREQVIAMFTREFPPAEAVPLLTALAGTRAEVAAVPMALQERAQRTVLETLPPGLGAIVVSKLGIPSKSDQEALEEVLSEQEKIDPSFRQRVEVEARRRHIPRWLAASYLRWNGMDQGELVAMLRRQPDDSTKGLA
jgi:hypothetical protein